MAIEGNSYSNLLLLMKNQGYNKDIKIIIAKIKNLSPLSIDMGKYTVDEEDLFITDRITTLNTSETIPEDKKLQVGDAVIVLVDEHDFYILDRVVNL